MKPFGYIYKIENLINGKVYIGQTIQPIEDRFAAHIRSALNGEKTYFYNAIRKYGAVNFSLELLEVCKSLDEMNGYEIRYIDQFDSFRNGYNMTLGGTGRSGYEYHASEETRKKISEANKKRFKNPKNHPRYGTHPIPWNKGKKGVQSGWNKGLKMSKEFREKLSKAKRGCIPWNKGKTGIYSEETRRRISEANKGRVAWNKGKPMKEESKEKLRQANLGKKHSEETRQKMRGCVPWNKNKTMNAEQKEKISIAKKGKKPNLSINTRNALSIKAKEQWKIAKLDGRNKL